MSQHPLVTRVIHAPHLSKLSDEQLKKIYDEAPPVERTQFPQIRWNTQSEDASVFTKAKRLAKELKDWNAAGRPLASRELRKARLATCATCEYFNKNGNLFLGECKAPGCGCSKAKAFLLTSKCPYPGGSKWPDPKQY